METNTPRSSEVLTATINSVLKLLECPNCHKVPKERGFKQCANGHVLCPKCTENSLQCLALNCKQTLMVKEPLIYRQLIEVLPSLCENKGCTKFITIRNNHNDWCEFDETTCHLCSPPSVYLRSELLGHVNMNHSQSIVHDNSVEYTVKAFTGDGKKDAGIIKKFPLPTAFCVFEQFFWLTLRHYSEENTVIIESSMCPLCPFIRDAFCCTVEMSNEDGTSLVCSTLLKKIHPENKYSPTAEFTLKKITLSEFIGETDITFKITLSKIKDATVNRNSDNAIQLLNKNEPRCVSLNDTNSKPQNSDDGLRGQLSVEEQREIVGDVLRLMACPECHKLPSLEQGKPQQCLSGHVVCNPCRNILYHCPSCKSPFIKKVPSLYCKVLQVLPKP